MGIAGSTLTPVAEYISCRCGEQAIGKGQLVRLALDSDDYATGCDGDPPDGITVMWCDRGYEPVGVAAHSAIHGEPLRVQVYGHCDHLMTDGNVVEGDSLFVSDTVLGVAAGYNVQQLHDVFNSQSDLLGVSMRTFGVALKDDTTSNAGNRGEAVLTAAWVRFK